MNILKQIEDFERNNPTMSLDTTIGSKILFTGKGGYDKENEWTNEILTAGQTYTLSIIDVGNWSSRVWIEEFPLQNFNSVMFQNIGTTELHSVAEAEKEGLGGTNNDL